MHSVELLIATINNDDTIVDKMNIQSPAIIANQSACYNSRVINRQFGEIKIITTHSKGVGINRNLALNLSSEDIVLFLDDDMVLCDNYEVIISETFQKNPVDIIIFNFTYIDDNGEEKLRFKASTKLTRFNALKYGICATAVRRSVIQKFNLSFSTIFGGGCIYGSGEDSLFLLSAFRKHLKIYLCENSIGTNYPGESTWFSGFNKKYFYDKGAWIACAFPVLKHIVKFYYVIRFRKITECTMKETRYWIDKGIDGFDRLLPFSIG